ncbi:MAG: HD domain-containing phosphohydrolase, partial [Acidobacteriota bacterium]
VVVPGRRPRRYKLAWVLTAVLLLIGILPVYTVSSRLMELNKESLKTQQQVIQLQLASSVAHHLDSFVRAQKQEVKILAEVVGIEMPGRSPRSFLKHLTRERILSRFVTDSLILIHYTHRDGNSVTSKQAGFDLNRKLEEILANAFVRQMNTGVMDEVAVGVPFYSQDARGPVVLLSTPVGQNGKRVGVLSALLRIKSLGPHAPGLSGYTLFALNQEGEIFSGSEKSSLYGIPYQDLEIVREFIASGGSRVMPYTAKDVGGKKVHLIGAYAQTTGGWGVFVQADQNRAYYMVEVMKWNTWFHAGMAAVGAVLVGLLFAGWISQPIKRLADSSLAFAEGDFHSRVAIGSRHEVGELAETFNVMAETLERYIARLKHAAIENTQLFLGSIRALAAAIDAKDAYTRGHSERVCLYAATLARSMNLPAEEVWMVEIGALLHDVGKIGVDDRILNKPGALTPEEYEIMKTHPVRGAEIMESIRQLRKVIPTMKHHHERWDGGGYPSGLKGEEIPFAARLVTIVDCWDAMTTNRPYQK